MASIKFTKYVVLWREHNTIAGYSCTYIYVMENKSVKLVLCLPFIYAYAKTNIWLIFAHISLVY